MAIHLFIFPFIYSGAYSFSAWGKTDDNGGGLGLALVVSTARKGFMRGSPWRVVWMLALALLWLGCRSAPSGNPDLVQKFSPGVFTAEDRLNEGLPGGFGTFLKAAGEPRISGAGKDFGLRLSFTDWDKDHVIRLEGNEGSARLVIKTIMTDGERPEEIRVTREVRKEIAPAALDQLRHLAGRVPRLDGFDGVLGKDGWSLLLEIVENGEYRAMYRWTPEYETRRRKLREFAALAEFLIEEARPVMNEPIGVDVTNLLRSVPDDSSFHGTAREALRIIRTEKRKADWLMTGGLTPSARTAEIYRIRHERLLQRKVRTGGFEETVAALLGSSDELQCATYETERHVVIVFLNATTRALVGCLYLEREK